MTNPYFLTRSIKQKGAAMLMALLTVALVAVLSSWAMWQLWRTTEVETTERSFQQSRWLLNGALDWARVVLREDKRASELDHLGEPWAVPLKESRLSAFLASDSSGGVEDEQGLLNQVFLSGRISDLQSRINVNNLLDGGRLSPTYTRAFIKLFSVLGLPMSELDLFLQNFLAVHNKSSKEGNTPIMPQRLEQLTWLGLSPQTVAQLAPHVTVLPAFTPLNLNTASAEAIFASIPLLEMSTARNWVRKRQAKHWTSLDAMRSELGVGGANINEREHQLSTKYFEVIGQVRYNQLVLIERSVVLRDGADLKILWRERRPPGAQPGCLLTIDPPC